MSHWKTFYMRLTESILLTTTNGKKYSWLQPSSWSLKSLGVVPQPLGYRRHRTTPEVHTTTRITISYVSLQNLYLGVL